jgi:NAD(P)-dependent dehydrogenase (short-subunit alcohol dehydrogenase family)
VRESAAIVTGAAGAIGSAICLRLSRAGFHVVGIDIQTPQDETTASFIKFDLARLAHDKADVIDECRQLLLGAVGSQRSIKLLVNNAATQKVCRFSEISLSDWQSTLAINVTAPFLLSQMLLPHLSKVEGAIVNIGSIHASQTKPGFVAYATSKAGLEGLTQALAVEVGELVRVNSILPAAVDTPMLREGFMNEKEKIDLLSAYHPTGCIASSEEVAEIVLWLASSELKCMNGASIRADGGIGARLHDPT